MEEPRATDGVAGEHDGGRAGVEQGEGGRAAVDVAGGDDGDGQLGRQGRRDAVVGAAAVELGRRARVDADGGCAGGDEAGRQPAPRLVALAQPGADLDRDRHARRHGGDHGAHDGLRRLRRAEQRRAGAGLDDLAHRAGHVEVDQVGAGGHADLGGARQRGRVGAEELEADRVLVLAAG